MSENLNFWSRYNNLHLLRLNPKFNWYLEHILINTYFFHSAWLFDCLRGRTRLLGSTWSRMATNWQALWKVSWARKSNQSKTDRNIHASVLLKWSKQLHWPLAWEPLGRSNGGSINIKNKNWINFEVDLPVCRHSASPSWWGRWMLSSQCLWMSHGTWIVLT